MFVGFCLLVSVFFSLVCGFFVCLFVGFSFACLQCLVLPGLFITLEPMKSSINFDVSFNSINTICTHQ